MKTAILYKSFLGTTQQYAEWLEELLKGKSFRWGKVSKEDLKDFDVVVISSGTYAGWMPLGGYLKKNWEFLKEKHVVVVAVGADDPDSEASKQSYEKIPENIRKEIKYYKIPGSEIAGAEKDKKVKKENLDPIVTYINNLSR